jgi:hypothetical protein
MAANWLHSYLTSQVIDDQGVNRTPKPLTAILPSAALRQARGIAADEGGALGSEASFDALAERGGCLSSSGFSRGWFSEIPSGGLTPAAAEANAMELDRGAGASKLQLDNRVASKDWQALVGILWPYGY